MCGFRLLSEDVRVPQSGTPFCIRECFQIDEFGSSRVDLDAGIGIHEYIVLPNRQLDLSVSLLKGVTLKKLPT